jgi:hypothetical protein
VLDDTVASPRLREILILLARMAFGGLLEYYGGWDSESAGWTLSREALLAEELEHLSEADWIYEGTETVRARTKTEDPPRLTFPPLPPGETEVPDRRPQPRAIIPAGAPVSLRGLAIRRQQERGIDVLYG